MSQISICQFDQYWKSDCRLRMSKLGDIQIKSKFDFCTKPPLLDISVQVDQHTWKLSFMASNRRESRIIGLEYWPLRLHVNFYPTFDNGYEVGQSVQGCMESLKNGEELCFLNTTVTTDGHNELESYAICPSLSEVNDSSTMSILVLCLLLSILLISFSLGTFVWCRRQKANNRHRNRTLEACIPPLPQSKPYLDQTPTNGYRSSVSIVSRSRTLLNPITEEESISSTNHFVSANDETPSRWRESKLIQTSLPSLEAAQNLISDSDSSQCPDTVSPNELCPQTNDKEKLIYSSSSESSV